jgi:hypothetical protein
MPALIEAQQFREDVHAELAEHGVADVTGESPTHPLVECGEQQFIRDKDCEGDKDRSCGIVFEIPDEKDEPIAAAHHEALPK